MPPGAALLGHVPSPRAERQMCARRFLFVVFILTLLAVAGAFAYHKW